MNCVFELKFFHSSLKSSDDLIEQNVILVYGTLLISIF